MRVIRLRKTNPAFIESVVRRSELLSRAFILSSPTISARRAPSTFLVMTSGAAAPASS
jgi:hypothetical protein